jgi:prepilin-type N-terminal cleavage/methylation domain-containing protein
MKKLRDSSGYTVIEMLVVLGVLSIFATIMLFSYYNYMSRTRVKTAIREIILIKKGLNNMANVCQGFPIREAADVTDMNSILPIIDLTECQGALRPENDYNPTVYPTDRPCTGDSLGTEVSHAFAGSGLSTLYHSSTLCRSSCASNDKGCISGMNENFHSVFITVAGDDCSPNYGGTSGSEFPGSYMPGWNYVLLHDNGGTAGLDKPVGVICGFALGVHNTTVKIVVNTGGHYQGKDIPEGAGMLDIDGGDLPTPCPCGPWCQDTSSGREGCCGDGNCQNPPVVSVGYKF